MLGKRARQPMKRTTSMTEFTLDFNAAAAEGVFQPSDPHNPFNGGVAGLDQRYAASAAAATRPQRRNSADFVGTTNFLRVCCLCKRRLVPGRDIYMYRGDSAFCSLECREQQMTQDERKEKCSWATKKDAASAAAGSQVSAAGGTVAAV
ncbi:FCS-Like Zinc finger 5 [Sesamum alatum]|uniref:FCS-Like Zinc finger 5 n=1 Tax=Sesamum alatum TaxID=300844 RepID=A0AAE1YQL0_9LAMI|nr:FCS-Like Zinc finger 5 [Sesamum alatum]